MEIGPTTKLEQIIKDYPFIIDFLVTKSPLYRNLKNPLMRKTVGKVATLAQVAAIGKKDLNDFLYDITTEIKQQTGEEVTVVGATYPIDLARKDRKSSKKSSVTCTWVLRWRNSSCASRH